MNDTLQKSIGEFPDYVDIMSESEKLYSQDQEGTIDVQVCPWLPAIPRPRSSPEGQAEIARIKSLGRKSFWDSVCDAGSLFFWGFSALGGTSKPTYEDVMLDMTTGFLMGGAGAGPAKNMAGSAWDAWLKRGVVEIAEKPLQISAFGRRLGRRWGDGSGPWGSSWGEANEVFQTNYAFMAGLPACNSGEFIMTGVLVVDVKVGARSALPIGGNLGGAQEFLVPNAQAVIQLDFVTGGSQPLY